MNQSIHKLASYLLEGNERAAMDYVKTAVHYPRIELFRELFTPAMQYIGELWEKNEITVADEHVATATCDFLLSRLYPLTDNKPSKKRAMFLCLEGEQHYLGLKMVNSLFEEEGWDTLYFGPNLPLEYAMKKAETWQPDVIGLSVSIVYHLPQLKSYIESFSNLVSNPTILVGGRIVDYYDLTDYCSAQTEIIGDLDELGTWMKNVKHERGENPVGSLD